MSCLDVMYHQSYGAHQYLPAAAAAAYTAAYYHHHHSQQQKLALYNKMQESMESNTQSKESEKEQPPEAEYISSRCVLLTYFQGDIGAVVDEHFSRALSQSSNFNADNPSSKPRASASSLWKEGSPFSTNQKNNFPASFWSSTYQAPAPPCLSGSHPDFSAVAGGVFHSPDSMAWPGHGLHQASAPPPNAEPWPYTLASQGSSSYPLVHEVYPHMHHPHAHTHHHSPHLDPRYGSLLVPSVRAARITTAPGEITKTDPTASAASSSWTGAFHGTLDMAQGVNFDTGLLHQEKNKEPTWF